MPSLPLQSTGLALHSDRHSDILDKDWVVESHPASPFRIRSATAGDKSAILALAKSLSEFFPEDVIRLIDESLSKHPCFAGLLDDEIVGFLVWAHRDSETAEILWMGIRDEYHGLGLGTMMLESLEQVLQKKGVTKLLASTLSYTVDYKPYEKVRAFYYNRGFKSLGIQQDYYTEGGDRLILLKRLG
jgi:ribosomal protein S18 acetylase RimI-like enzyme